MSATPQLRLVTPPRPRRPREPLWREVVGARLRHQRIRRTLTLVQVAARAGISPQYLSEVERGRKDPSSEVLAAVAQALGLGILEITHLASLDLRRMQASVPTAQPGDIQLAA